MSSLAAARNPLDPREALVFFHSSPDNNSAVINLGVSRRSLMGGENPKYRDFNVVSGNIRPMPAGLVIAFYNGAPRVFGFSKVEDDPERFVVTQLSPTWTPIDNVNTGVVQGLWSPAIAAISDKTRDTAYVFYLRPETTSKGRLYRYNLSKDPPQSLQYGSVNIDARSNLAAIKLRGTGQLKVFFQPEQNTNTIHVFDTGSQTSEPIPDLECASNSPIAVTHLDDDENTIPKYLFLYYIDNLRRIIRIRYSYETSTWLTTPSQVGQRMTPEQVWLAVVPVVEKEEVHVYYTEENSEIISQIDDTTKNVAPTAFESK